MTESGDDPVQHLKSREVAGSAEAANGEGSSLEGASWPDKPWLSIWIRPRGTIRAIVDSDPERYVMILAGLYGISQALDNASRRNLGESLPLIVVLIVAIFLGPIGGLISLYIGAAILRWTGSWLNGTATSKEVRAAIAWSYVPAVVGLFLWIPLLVLYGIEMFTSVTPRMDAGPWFAFLIGLLTLFLGIWTLFLLVKTLAEVHRFSAWRAIVAAAIPFLAVFLLIFGCRFLTGAYS